MKTYLVTGGAGFIGSNYIHYLFETYNDAIKVINIDCLTYAGNLENLKAVEERPNYIFKKINITNKDALTSVFEEHPIDYVLNFAAESHVDRSILDGRPFVETNILGTQVLLDVAKTFKVKRFLQVSTDEVYGSLGDSGFFYEDTPLKPNSPYSASKASADLIVRSYIKTHSMPCLITRCTNNYGPYQFPEKLIPLMFTNALENKALPVYGKGLNVRDWIFVKDHCSGIEATLQKGKIGEVYNLGGEAEMKNIDIVKEILTYTKKPESLITYVTDRLGHDFRYAMDIKKSRTELGWEPSVTFNEGLKLTLDWYSNNTEWWKSIKNGEYQHYYEKQYHAR